MNQIFKIIIELIPLFLIIGYVQRGWYRGGLYMLINLARFIFAFFAANAVTPWLTQQAMANGWIQAKTAAATAAVSNKASEMLTPVTSNLSGVGQSIDAMIQEGITGTASSFVSGLVFIIVFIIIMLVFRYFLHLALKANRIPIMGTLNQGLGAAAGLVYGWYLTGFIMMVVIFLLTYFGDTSTAEVFSNTVYMQLFERTLL